MNLDIIIPNIKSSHIQAYFSQENHCGKKAANFQTKQTLNWKEKIKQL